MVASAARSTLWGALFHRRGLRLGALLAALALLLATSLWPSSDVDVATASVVDGAAPDADSSTCAPARLPRVVSHRGVDEDVAGAVPTTAKSVTALLTAGITSFDVDVFWAADSGRELFLGHPPSLRKRWRLDAEVHQTPLAKLRQQALPDGGLLRLSDFLRILAGHRRKLGQVSLELKFASEQAEWRRRLPALYAQVAAARLSSQVAAVALDAAQAAAHRAAQAAAGLRVPVLAVLRDNDAPLGADGLPHANLSLVGSSDAPYDGWSASVRLLEPALRRAAATRSLAVWTVDAEADLRRSWGAQVDDVVTNRAGWARAQLARWRDEQEAMCRQKLASGKA